MKQFFFIPALFIVLLLAPVSGTRAQSWSNVGAIDALYAPYIYNTVCTDYLGNVYAAGYVADTLPGPYTPLGHYYVAKWNGTRWYELKDNDTMDHYVGPSIFPFVSICTDKTGYLYAVGRFTSVCKWDGRQWHALGWRDTAAHFFINEIYSNMVADSSGNIYVGGLFTREPADTAIVQDSFYLIKWDGEHWHMMDSNFFIQKLFVDQTDTLYAIGGFKNMRSCVAKWDGAAWHQLGTGAGTLYADDIESICTDGLGNLYAAVFVYPMPPYLAKWDGTAWSNTGKTFNSNVTSMVVDKNHNIYIAGTFADSAFNLYNVLKYDGTSFNPLGTPFYLPKDWDSTGIPPHFDGFYSIDLDTAGNVYGALWRGKATIVDSSGPFIFISTLTDTLSIVRYGTAFPIDTTILPPPDTINVPWPDRTKTATIIQPTGTIKVYPIPTHDVINIEMENLPSPAPYYIFNVEGKCILKGSLQEHASKVDLSMLPPGAYFLQIDNKRDQVFKVIRE